MGALSRIPLPKRHSHAALVIAGCLFPVHIDVYFDLVIYFCPAHQQVFPVEGVRQHVLLVFDRPGLIVWSSVERTDLHAYLEIGDLAAAGFVLPAEVYSAVQVVLVELPRAGRDVGLFEAVGVAGVETGAVQGIRGG